jgi:hypothetical protein
MIQEKSKKRFRAILKFLGFPKRSDQEMYKNLTTQKNPDDPGW